MVVLSPVNIIISNPAALQLSYSPLLRLLNQKPQNPACGSGTASSIINFSKPTRLLRRIGSSPYPSPLPFSKPISPNGLTSTQLGSQSDEYWEQEPNGFGFHGHVETSYAEMRKLPFTSLPLHVKELEELPENWRRSKLAWMCKELPAHKRPTITRILNAHKKWMRQDDATYIAVHCIRIRENEPAFWVFKWMSQQHWFQFDLALATKLADYMGREGKYAKCREIFNDIINQGRVPCESTFHILTVAYLSASAENCLHEAWDVYNQMIQMGGYKPQLSLHNALFRAFLGKPGSFAKQYLKQAEFIFHNIVATGFEIHADIFRGLIWLHSYQEKVDKERILSLRDEMQLSGIKESSDVLLSILRACSKVGDVAEAEKAWLKLLSCDGGIPSKAFVYKMQAYAKGGEPTKVLDVLAEMKELGGVSAAAYHKGIEVLCEAYEREISESLMKEFIGTSLKPLTPPYISLMNMYFRLGLHDKIECAFCACLEHCPPNRVVYGIYLDSLVQSGNIVKAEEVFSQMLDNNVIGVNSRSCNTMLKGYLYSEDHDNALKIYEYMCKKKYETDASLMGKLEDIIGLRRAKKKASSAKLSQLQREILVGLLLGGLRIEPDEYREQYFAYFEFNDSMTHSVLKRHIYVMYYEWLHPSSKTSDACDDVPVRFSTLSHASFRFYVDQFWLGGCQMVPKLIHRWLSPRAIAYWYMYGGHRTSSGDILLKLKADREGVERIIKALKVWSLACRVKQKGNVFWLGFLGSNSYDIWNLIQQFILDDLKEFLKADGNRRTSTNGRTDVPYVNFGGGTHDESENQNLH